MRGDCMGEINKYIKKYNAREFYNQSEIEQWSKLTFNKLTPDEKEYLNAYTKDEFLNNKIRKGIKFSNENEKMDEYLSRIINKNKIGETIVVYRGISKEGYKGMKKAYKDTYPNFDCDNKLFEKAYMSTSMIKGRELQYDYQLRIIVPKGTHAIYIGGISCSPYQVELLLGKNIVLKKIESSGRYIDVIVNN